MVPIFVFSTPAPAISQMAAPIFGDHQPPASHQPDGSPHLGDHQPPAISQMADPIFVFSTPEGTQAKQFCHHVFIFKFHYGTNISDAVKAVKAVRKSADVDLYLHAH